MINLDDLLDLAENQARRVLLELGYRQLIPIYLLVSANKTKTIACPWNSELDKQIMLAIVRDEAAKMKALALSHLSEAWVSKRYANLEEAKADVKPSQHPERREIVMILATNGVTTKARKLAIERDWKGKITELTCDELGSEDTFVGRMIDGLLPIGGRA